MALNELEQLKKMLEDKKNILISFRKDYSGDAIASSVALALFLEKLGKRVEIVVENFSLPKAFHFLKKAEEIKSNLNNLQKFIITVDIKQTGLNELSYDVKEEKLRIFITPQKGTLNRDQIRTAQSDFRYDLIFVLDTPDLEALGSLYENNTELFYKTPVVNIDYKTNNEHFGQINLVDITSTATAEVLYEMFETLNKEYVDEKISTAILTGIIANTHSFKSPNIKPKTLNLASKLMNLGADREYIVQNLYRTRSISTLKLWGIALSYLQSDPNVGLAWTTITRDDFVRSGAKPYELYEIVDELLSTSPEIKIFVLFHEQTNSNENPEVNVILNAGKNYDAKLLLTPFGNATGDKKQATTTVSGKKLKEAEDEVIAYIKKTAQ